jgi:predicted ArsR family transcriptional regulator
MFGNMSSENPLRTVDLTDPRALRAIAHPVRLSLVGLLRREGPMTATRAAELLGESAASCSFHLRQLAKYGLVEESGGGQGRERPWRATAQYTRWPNVASTPEQEAAAGLLSAVIAERHFEGVMRWLETKPDQPVEWQEAALFGDTQLYLTAGELRDLASDLTEVVERHSGRAMGRPRPDGARLVTVLRLAFPLAGAPEQSPEVRQ